MWLKQVRVEPATACSVWGNEEVTVMHPNVALLRESYESLDRSDWEAVRNTLTEDFVLAVAGRKQLAGETRGRDANIARQQRLVELLGGHPYHTEHIDMAVSKDRVFRLRERDLFWRARRLRR
jgi:ketosteroid isomerase-like protein